MEIGIELLFDRIDRFEAVSLEDLLHRVACHCESFVEVLQMGIAVVNLGFWHGLCGVSQNIGHLEQVLAEALYAKTFGILNLLGEPSPKVFGFRQRALVFVLDTIE